MPGDSCEEETEGDGGGGIENETTEEGEGAAPLEKGGEGTREGGGKEVTREGDGGM